MFDSISRNYLGKADFSVDTLYIYFSLVIIAFIFGLFSQKAKSLIYNNYYLVCGQPCVKNEFLFIAFVCLLLVSGLRSMGIDYNMYRDIYDYSNTKYSSDYSIEPGYLLINQTFSLLGFPFEFVVLILSALTIGIVLITIQKYGCHIDISLSLLAYVAIYYFQGFNLIRMYLAASITLFTFKYLIQNEIKKFFLIVFLTCTIHYSAVFYLIPSIGLIIFNKNRKIFWCVLIIGTYLAYKLISSFESLFLIERWSHYSNNNEVSGSSGLMQWFINLPIIALYLYSKNKIPNSKYLPSLIVFAIGSLIMGIFSYKISILGRSLVYYNVLFIIIVPIIIKQLNLKHTKWCKIIKYGYILYLLFRFKTYMSEYLYIDGIMPYKSILF